MTRVKEPKHIEDASDDEPNFHSLLGNTREMKNDDDSFKTP